MEGILNEVLADAGESFYAVSISYKLLQELELTVEQVMDLAGKEDLIELQADEQRILIGTEKEIDNLKICEEVADELNNEHISVI